MGCKVAIVSDGLGGGAHMYINKSVLFYCSSVDFSEDL